MSDSPEILKGDPARAAPDLHRGLNYQIWLSVEAWINLKEDELLHLEGAEDFDILTRSTGIMAQAKATAENITLRSRAVIEAIENFWLVSANHPGKHVKFRFITTSSIAVEKRNPFGQKRAGLILWKECVAKADLELAGRLQSFLANDAAISRKLSQRRAAAMPGSPTQPLLDFLRSAPPDEFMLRLLRPMAWETDGPDEEVIKTAVGMALRAYGEKLRYRPNESMAALDRLFRVAAETCKKPDERILTRDDFRREFSDATSKLLSHSEYAALQAAAIAGPSGTGMAQPTGALSLTTALPFVQLSPPALSTPTIRRMGLVTDLVSKLRKEGIILITGSSGMGKSTVAVLVADEFQQEWVWIDFQGFQPSAIPQAISVLALTFSTREDLKNICLDNLNFPPTDLLASENGIAAIVRMARNRAGSVIITSQRELPIRMLNKMCIRKASIQTMPHLNEEDIGDLADLIGCQRGPQRDLIAKFVKIQTHGHPRLAHARLVRLSMDGWPQPQFDDLLAQPQEVMEEREIARQLLDNAPSGDKELLYCLSLTIGPFRRDQAIAIGKTVPGVQAPADSFARLSGPWIDAIAENYHRLSPLLLQAASENWDTKKITNSRRAIARAVLATPNKSLIEANEILFQGLLSDDAESITGVVLSLQTAPQDATRAIADHLDWLQYWGCGNGQKACKSNTYTSLLLRLLQFRITAEAHPDNVAWICSRIDDEMLALNGELRSHFRLMWLMMAVILVQAKIPPEKLIAYWLELVQTLNEPTLAEEVAGYLDNVVRGLNSLGGSLPLEAHLLMMVLARRWSSLELTKFGAAVNCLPSTSKQDILRFMRQLEFRIRAAVNRAAFVEVDRNAEDWNSVLANLDTFSTQSRDWEIPSVFEFTARAKAAILDEYLNEPDHAIAVLNDAKAASNACPQFMDDQLAHTLYRQGKYREAVEIWRAILPNWPVEQLDYSPLYAAERAGSAAAQIPDWQSCIRFFQSGQAIANQLSTPIFVAAFLSDEALALWKGGLRDEALNKLAQSIDLLAGTQAPKDDELQFRLVKKSTEQILLWCRKDAGCIGGENTWEPPVGFCSRLGKDERIASIPVVPFDLDFYFLAELEVKIRGPGPIYDRARALYATSQYVMFRNFISELEVRVAFAERRFERLFPICQRLAQTASDLDQHIRGQGNGLKPDCFQKVAPIPISDVATEPILASLFVMANSEPESATCLADWRMRAAESKPLEKGLVELIDEVRRVKGLPKSDIQRIAREGSNHIASEVIAAIRISNDADVSPVGMLVGHMRLLEYFSSRKIGPVIEGQFASVVTTQWLRRCKLPAALNLPRITVPAIRLACESEKAGFKKVASVLLAARNAVNLSVPEALLQKWRQMAAG